MLTQQDLGFEHRFEYTWFSVGGAATVWLAFTVWYTDFGGPLTDAEIAQALVALERRGMEPERFDQFERFLREDSGNQFLGE